MARLSLRHPIFLVHGLGARGKYGPVRYFYGIERLLTAEGNVVRSADLTPWNSIENRAAELKAQIERQFPHGERVNLICHSMGGLDARYMVAQLGMRDRVASVTTIGTTHRGSYLADYALKSAAAGLARLARPILSLFGVDLEGIRQVSTEYCQTEFHQLAPRMAGVGYFSATSVIRKPLRSSALPFFWIPHRMLNRIEGENDGLVSESSSRWGEHIRTDYGDHYAQIGQFMGRARGLDFRKLYLDVARRLRREGF